MERAVRADAKRYQRSGKAHRRWFRFSGLVEIVLGVSFPFVVVLQPQNNTLLTGISVGIALVGALSGFYAWNDNWRLYKTQELVLTVIIRRWELALLRLSASAEDNMAEAHAATEQAIKELGAVLEHEQDSYFGAVKAPRDLLAGPPSAGDQPV